MPETETHNILPQITIYLNHYIIKIFICKEIVICRAMLGVIFLAIIKSDIIFTLTLAKQISLGKKLNITA